MTLKAGDRLKYIYTHTEGAGATAGHTFDGDTCLYITLVQMPGPMGHYLAAQAKYSSGKSAYYPLHMAEEFGPLLEGQP